MYAGSAGERQPFPSLDGTALAEPVHANADYGDLADVDAAADHGECQLLATDQLPEAVAGRPEQGEVTIVPGCEPDSAGFPVEGATSNLLSTVPEIERYVEPRGAIGSFLAMRFKDYSNVHKGRSKRIWDMAAAGWLLDSDWVPSVLTSAPILSDRLTWSRDHRRHQIRCVVSIDRDAGDAGFHREA